MKTLVFASVILSCFCGLCLAGDHAYRPELQLKGPISDSFGWGFKLETVFVDDVNRAPGVKLLATVAWKPFRYFAVVPEFYYVTSSGGPAHQENRPRVSFVSGSDISLLSWSVRNRFEYRMRASKDYNYWRYRGRLMLKLPMVFHLVPFAYDEVFSDFGPHVDYRKVSHNEAGVGLGIPLGPGRKLNTDLRFLHTRGAGVWSDSDVHLLTTLVVGF